MKTILYYSQDYEDVNYYVADVPDNKIKVARRIIEAGKYNYLGVIDKRPREADKLSIEKIIKSLPIAIEKFSEAKETSLWQEDKKRKDELKNDPNPSISISAWFPSSPADLPMDVYLASRDNDIYQSNKIARRNRKLIKEYKK